MNDVEERLYRLIPEVYRFRDKKGELRALLRNVDRVMLAIEGDIDRLYENWFIETCEEWVVPYIADLLGVKGLNPASPRTFSQRGYVANVLAYRRRKGTAAMLEQLAEDHTGWAAHAVEFFERLATTQHLNHLRLDDHAWVDVRNDAALDLVSGPFDAAAHTVEVRRPDSASGRYNVQNVGLFLWRLEGLAITLAQAAPAADVPAEAGLFRFSALGHDMPLFNRRRREGDIEKLATENVVPGRLRRRALHDDLEEFCQAREELGESAPLSSRFFGVDASLAIEVGGEELPVEALCICNLSEWKRPADVAPVPGAWPAKSVAIDPVLGRIAFAASVAPATPPLVRYFYGFADTLGGGGYARPPALAATEAAVTGGAAALSNRLGGGGPAYVPVSTEEQSRRVDALRSRLPRGQAALAKTPAIDRFAELLSQTSEHAIVEIGDSLTYSLASFAVPANSVLEIRAADGARPLVVLEDPAEVTLGSGSVLVLSGLVLSAKTLAIAQAPEAGVLLDHCTLVPGLALTPGGEPADVTQPSVRGPAHVERFDLLLHRSITGPLVLGGPLGSDHTLFIQDSIVDAAGGPLAALAAPHASVVRATIFGETELESLELATDTIFTATVEVQKTQHGCVRFSFVPEGSLVSQPYRCQPALALQVAAGAGASPAALTAVAARVVPEFTSQRYGDPGYAQLRAAAAPEIRRGASNEAAMGAFNFVMEPQREDNLRTSLAEYLRFGLEAGIFYVT